MDEEDHAFLLDAGDATFNVVLSKPTGGATLGRKCIAEVAIVDHTDDSFSNDDNDNLEDITADLDDDDDDDFNADALSDPLFKFRRAGRAVLLGASSAHALRESIKPVRACVPAAWQAVLGATGEGMRHGAHLSKMDALPAKTLRALIGSILRAKVLADKVDASCGTPSQDLPAFVQEWLHHHLGLKKLADHKLIVLFTMLKYVW
eukprot:jgi/Chlat1/681/Chrsp104S01279